MNWVAFSVLLLIVTVLQTSVAPFIAVNTIRPDFMVIFAVYCALTARAQDGMLACWITGLVIDLTSLGYTDKANVGFHALCLGLIGAAITRTRHLTFRESMATHMFYTLAVTFLVTTTLGWHMLYGRFEWGRFAHCMAVALYTAIYSAVLAPYGHWCLKQLRGLLGIGSSHRLHAR
jgi:rod shape-determining protein MreD